MIHKTAMAIVTGALLWSGSTAALGAKGTTKRSYYRGSAEGKVLSLQVTRKPSGKRFVKLRTLSDGCAGDALESVAVRLRNGAFVFDESGSTSSTGYSARAEGRFTGPDAGTVTTHSARGSLYPADPGAAGTADICTADAVFTIRRTRSETIKRPG